MRALVTGGTGFVGSHLVDDLLRQDYSVRVLIRPESNLRYLTGKPVSLALGDLTEPRTLRDACEGRDAVFHVAGLPHEHRFRRSFHEINTQGTKNLLDACVETHVPRVVLMSSASVYGFPPVPVLTEDAATTPSTVYGKSKYLAEQLLWDYGRDHGLHTAAVRAPWITGPRNYKAPRLINLVKTNRFFYVHSTDTRLSIVDARDVASCLRIAAENDRANGQPVNVTSFDCTIGEFIGEFAKALSVPAPRGRRSMAAALLIAASAEAAWSFSQRWNPPLSRHQVKTLGATRLLDTTRAAALGYHPQYTMPQTVADTVHWAQDSTGDSAN